jgi:hypothetical protein
VISMSDSAIFDPLKNIRLPLDEKIDMVAWKDQKFRQQVIRITYDYLSIPSI